MHILRYGGWQPSGIHPGSETIGAITSDGAFAAPRPAARDSGSEHSRAWAASSASSSPLLQGPLFPPRPPLTPPSRVQWAAGPPSASAEERAEEAEEARPRRSAEVALHEVRDGRREA